MATPHTTRRRAGTARFGLAAATVSALLLTFSPASPATPASPAAAETAPPGVTADVAEGYVSLSWQPVGGAEAYQIERAPVVGDEPAGPGEVVGIWTPTRAGDHVTPGPLTFADAGFVLGERYRWRVRAVVDGAPGEWSAPVTRDTPRPAGPEEFQTPFERSNGAEWTTHEEEVALVEAIAAASDRVRLETLGHTYQGRPIQLAVIGDPAPGSAAEVAEGPAVLISANIHGTERSGREASLILLRELAFSDEAWARRILSEATILINPTGNPDGQALGIRGNTTGQDLNRDHVLLRHPESIGLARTIRDYQPELVIDPHENPGRGGDVEFLWPRSRNVEEGLWHVNQNVFGRGHMYGAAAATGFSPGQWGTHRTDNWETLLMNVAGLKNTVGLLQEINWNPAPARPAEGPNGAADNQRRRGYTALWGLRTALDYHHENHEDISAVLAEAAATQSSNEGPVYLDGAYDIPVNPPINEPPTVVLEQPICGYRLSPQQYATRDGSTEGDEVEWTSPTVEERLAAHGVEVEPVGAGIVQVPFAQPLRGLLPYLLDPELETATRPAGTPNIGMVRAVRLDDARATVVVGDVDTGVGNVVDDDGCTVNDHVADEQEWPTHGAFVRHVREVVADLRSEDLLDAREAGAIQRAAARSTIGR